MVSIILLLLLALPSLAHAATYYVSTSGSDSNNGTSESTPFRTVAKCTDTMVAGDTCYVRAGTYAEGVVRFRRSGTSTAPIILSNYPGESPRLNFISSANNDRIFIQHSSGQNVAIGWIVIQGLELTGGHDGIKYHSLHDAIFRNLHIHDNAFMGILGIGGTRIVFDRNLIHHNGRFASCDAGTTTLCWHDHGLYLHGTFYTITNNIFYWHQGYGVQQNGSATSAYSSSVHAGPEFAGATDWVVVNNTFAYSRTRGGMVVWGGLTSRTRIENNIFYENSVEVNSEPQGIKCTSCGSVTDLIIRNNHAYASGSGGTAFTGGSTFPTGAVISGNIVNVSAPSFVNGGSNSLPVSPDFRIASASSPTHNMGRAQAGRPHCGSAPDAGAFELCGPISASAAGTSYEVVMESAFPPLQVPGSAGWSISAGTISGLSRKGGTDSVVAITLAAACTVGAKTVSYDASTGSLSDDIKIGNIFSQRVLSFGPLSVTDNCDGEGGPPPPSTGLQQYLPLDGNANDASGENNHGTATGGSYVEARYGQGFQTTNGQIERINLNFGNGLNPTETDLTLAFAVNVTEPSLNRTYAGSDFNADKRFHVGTREGTWGLGIQGSALTTTSDLVVTAGQHMVVVYLNSTTDTATVCVDGVMATSGSGVKSYTSYTLGSDISVGLPINFTAVSTPSAVYDEVRRWNSIVSCTEIYESWNPPTAPGGTFSQVAVRAQDVFTTLAGTPVDLNGNNTAQRVVRNGAVAWNIQVNCSECDSTAFRVASRKNGAGDWQQIPASDLGQGLVMWGSSMPPYLNLGDPGEELTGSCAHQVGATILTADQIPTIAFPTSGCVVLRPIVRLGANALPGDYFEIRLELQGGVPLSIYEHVARIEVIPPQMVQ